ncbi:hypothetical protein L218DRAFT_501861 [Marasmius fiardii PR-910]|nr:hypothetical protein L218DRAFT_501861 [Marasmius fiardii PR-910]
MSSPTTRIQKKSSPNPRAWKENDDYNAPCQEFNCKYPIGGEGLEKSFRKSTVKFQFLPNTIPKKPPSLAPPNPHTPQCKCKIRFCLSQSHLSPHRKLHHGPIKFYNLPTTTDPAPHSESYSTPSSSAPSKVLSKILTLYEQRPIVGETEPQPDVRLRFALHIHPFAFAFDPSVSIIFRFRTIRGLVEDD